MIDYFETGIDSQISFTLLKRSAGRFMKFFRRKWETFRSPRFQTFSRMLASLDWGAGFINVILSSAKKHLTSGVTWNDALSCKNIRPRKAGWAPIRFWGRHAMYLGALKFSPARKTRTPAPYAMKPQILTLTYVRCFWFEQYSLFWRSPLRLFTRIGCWSRW